MLTAAVIMAASGALAGVSALWRHLAARRPLAVSAGPRPTHYANGAWVYPPAPEQARRDAEVAHLLPHLVGQRAVVREQLMRSAGKGHDENDLRRLIDTLNGLDDEITAWRREADRGTAGRAAVLGPGVTIRHRDDGTRVEHRPDTANGERHEHGTCPVCAGHMDGDTVEAWGSSKVWCSPGKGGELDLNRYVDGTPEWLSIDTIGGKRNRPRNPGGGSDRR